MIDLLWRPPTAIIPALEHTAASVARLDQALATHPLRPAFLYRARLEAVRRQAMVDGQAIDPWHLAAVLEGLRLRMDGALRIVDRGMIFAAAHHALHLHQWLTAPDEAQQTAIARAAAQLAEAEAGATPLLAAALGLHAWLEQGGARPPMRAALLAHWTRHRLLRTPVPLTGAGALRPGTPWAPDAWVASFLSALAEEAQAGLQLLGALERAWFAARGAVATLVAEFNARYMVVNEAGRAVIYAPKKDSILNRSFHDRLSFEDFRRLYLNRSLVADYTKKGEPIVRRAADVWLHHHDRRQFLGGVTFDPSGRGSPADTLNLWQGFAVEPKPGNWTLMREHIRVIICRENPEHFDYLMGWMARLVQHPAKQGEVAVVLRGGEGTGKGTLARVLKHILGQHALAVSNPKHLTGNFNAHLRDCVFLFADEAFFAGDRQHVGVLKSIITEPYLTIEGKYQNAVQMPNFLHLMMASNEEWVVPASLEARRFFVLEVGDEAKNNHDYFGAIWQQMESGGYQAMLHDLLQHDLAGFNVRQAPVTEALQHQKKLSLSTAEAWWLDVLLRGYVFKSRLGLEDYFSQWNDEVSTELLCASYSEYADHRRERHPHRLAGHQAEVLDDLRGVPVRAGDAVGAGRAHHLGAQQVGLERPPGA